MEHDKIRIDWSDIEKAATPSRPDQGPESSEPPRDHEKVPPLPHGRDSLPSEVGAPSVPRHRVVRSILVLLLLLGVCCLACRTVQEEHSYRIYLATEGAKAAINDGELGQAVDHLDRARNLVSKPWYMGSSKGQQRQSIDSMLNECKFCLERSNIEELLLTMTQPELEALGQQGIVPARHERSDPVAQSVLTHALRSLAPEVPQIRQERERRIAADRMEKEEAEKRRSEEAARRAAEVVAKQAAEAARQEADRRRIVESAIPSVQLALQYDEHEIRADQAFKDQIITVKGSVVSIGKDIAGTPYITLEGKGMRSIQCFFSGSDESSLADINPRDFVLVTGRCDGLFMNVLLKNCSFTELPQTPSRH